MALYASPVAESGAVAPFLSYSSVRPLIYNQWAASAFDVGEVVIFSIK